MRVFEQIRSFIEAKGFKQIVIARNSGIPYKTFNLMLLGKRKIYVDEFNAICRALDVQPDLFLGGQEKCL